MAKRITRNIEKIIVQRAVEEDDYVEYVLNETKSYSNQKRTGEILANVATKKKDVPNEYSKNFVQDAIKFSNIFQNKISYEDPDKASVQLYKFWGEFLQKKGIIQKYEIIYKNYWFRLKIVFGKDKNELILGSDGIVSHSKIKNDKIILDYRTIGGFMIWPVHSGGINFRKNRFNDRIDLTMQEIKKYYCDLNLTNFNPSSDMEWFKHLGCIYSEKEPYESFCKCFELEVFNLHDAEGYYEQLLVNIKERAKAMRNVFS